MTLQPDYSTINMEALRRFPVYNKPPTYQIDRHMGSACAGDPPGYPSYFLQSVYTQHGNTPHNGPDYVIRDNEGNYRRLPDLWAGTGVSYWDRRRKVLDKLWLPPPVDSERVWNWMIETYRHHKHCYRDPLAENPNSSDATVVWPVSKFYYPLRPKQTIKDYNRIEYSMSDEQYRIVLSGYRAQVKALLQKVWSVAKDNNNSSAWIIVRQFYPDVPFMPWLSWKHFPAFQHDWWERYIHKPAEDECPGFYDKSHAHNMKAYGNCRMCGLVDESQKNTDPKEAWRYR